MIPKDDFINDTTELANCIFVKAILMVLIVLYHSSVFWTGTWLTVEPVYSSVFLATISKWLNSFHIYAFTFVSGYVYYYGRYEAGKYASFRGFLKGKIKRLVIPLYFVGITWACWIDKLFFGTSITVNIKKYILCEGPSQLWFLMMLFDVFIVFYLISSLSNSNTIISLVVVICLYIVGFVGNYFLPNYFQIWTGLNYVIYFWIGFQVRRVKVTHPNLIVDSLWKIHWGIWVVVDIILFIASQYLAQYNIALIKCIGLGLTIVVHIVGSLMAFFVLQRIANRFSNWENSRMFGFFTKRSMVVYLYHQQIIYFSIFFLNGIVNPYLNAGVNFISAMIISLLIASIMVNFKTTRLLVGEK